MASHNIQISHKSPEYPEEHSHVAFPLEIKHFPPFWQLNPSQIAKTYNCYCILKNNIDDNYNYSIESIIVIHLTSNLT